MKCPRIYATADGESHFCEADIASTWTPLFASEAAFGVSAHYPASHVPFGHSERRSRAGWRAPPGRVLALWLDRVVEFEASDGEVPARLGGGLRPRGGHARRRTHLTPSR